MLVTVIAIAEEDKDEFQFYMDDSATDKEITDKAFEIAYCKHDDLTMVRFERGEND